MGALGFERDLGAAAEFYNLSKDVRDYILQPVPIIWSDLPNRNGVAFPISSLTEWVKEKGCRAYMGWKGQAVRLEHDWEGEAIGLIPDVAIRPLRGFGNNRLWKIVLLHAVDRTKNVEIAKAIETGKRNSWSMGCLVSYFTCSVCGSDAPSCDHLRKDETFRVTSNGITFRNAHGIMAEESSSVGDPAYGQAIGEIVVKYT